LAIAFAPVGCAYIGRPQREHSRALGDASGRERQNGIAALRQMRSPTAGRSREA